MSVYLQIFLVTALTGIGGLALGGGLAVLVHNPSDKQMSLLLRFTAGRILRVSHLSPGRHGRKETVSATWSWSEAQKLLTGT